MDHRFPKPGLALPHGFHITVGCQRHFWQLASVPVEEAAGGPWVVIYSSRFVAIMDFDVLATAP